MDDAEEAAGTRAAQVCHGCRMRHKRCDWENEICQQCRSNGLECVRQASFRFRYDPKQTALARGSADLRRSWPLPHAPLTFHDLTPELREMYAVGTTSASLQQTDLLIQPPSILSPMSNPASLPNTMSAYYLASPDDQTSPETVAGGSLGPQVTSHPFSHLEAILVRNFASKMALWSDATDPARTFEVEVPLRALTEPLLKHAICAFSARHFYRGSTDHRQQSEALEHQNRCLELLIPAVSGGQGINESMLTAVAILRQNEEMDETDNRFHLEGISRILNTVPHFVAAGGLGEAAAWLCLREDIYVSLTTQSPISINLDSFEESSSIRRGDDYSWANKMVLILAHLLNRLFNSSRTDNHLVASEAEVANWDRSKPMSYNPIHFEPRSRSAERSLPDIWMLSPHHAVGMQYFHIAKIVLNVMTQQRASSQPYSYLVDNRIRERHVRHHLLLVIGLAVSNEAVENIWFTARHCLSIWAGCLRKRADKDAAIQFLQDMGRRTGWETRRLIESLHRQWDDDSESG